MANEKIRVTVVLEYDVMGEYTSDQYEVISEQAKEGIEEGDAFMLYLDDGTRLTLDKAVVESIEEI
jgi:hypothetical protein